MSYRLKKDNFLYRWEVLTGLYFYIILYVGNDYEKVATIDT